MSKPTTVVATIARIASAPSVEYMVDTTLDGSGLTPAEVAAIRDRVTADAQEQADDIATRHGLILSGGEFIGAHGEEYDTDALAEDFRDNLDIASAIDRAVDALHA